MRRRIMLGSALATALTLLAFGAPAALAASDAPTCSAEAARDAADPAQPAAEAALSPEEIAAPGAPKPVSGCSVSARCEDGSTISCSGNWECVRMTYCWVQCDSVTTYCEPEPRYGCPEPPWP